MSVIRYSLWGANSAGITIHPTKEIERLGMKCLKFEGAPIGDCAFMEVDKVADRLPDYIELSDYKLIE